MPVTPVVSGRPVAFVKTPEAGVPRAGVTSVGEVANTRAPEPVSSVTAAARFADEGVAKKVATPEPRPDTPVAIGSPVALVSVTLVGVPRIGVTKVGLVAKTAEPLPVSSVSAAARFAELGVPRNVATPAPKLVMPVPPLATGSVPVTPVVKGKPVKFVATPDAGVPSAGVTSVGLVAKTKAPVPVSPVTAAAKLAEEGVPKKVATPVPKPLTPVLIGSPVALVKVADDGVPRAGVTSVGEFDNTVLPVPVEVVTPVPPLATAKVPATVTAPEVAVAGVKPVDPKLMVDTPSTTLEATFTKSVLFQAATQRSPATMVIPGVGDGLPVPRSTMEPVPSLTTT